MSDLEQLITDTLRERAGALPAAELPRLALAVRPRRRRVVWTVATAAVVAAALVVGVATWQGSRHRAASSGVVAPVPAGLQEVSYHGITLDVPSSWVVTRAWCSAPTVDAVVPDDGWGYSCPYRGGPSPTAAPVSRVDLQPYGPERTGVLDAQSLATRPVVVDGHPAREGAGALATVAAVSVLAIPDPGVLVTVTGPAQRTAAALFASVRIVPVDRLGCRSHLTSATPTGNPAADRLVPPGPVAGVVCQYLSVLPYGSGYWLVGSRVLSQDRVAAIARGRVGRAAPKPFQDSAGWLVWYQLGYPGGGRRTVAVSEGFAPELATDGRRTVVFPDTESLPTLFNP